jgi:import receptor subunit TOM20
VEQLMTDGVLKRGLVATKDIVAGEVIFREDPIVSALNPSVQEQAQQCTFCHKKIVSPITDSLNSDWNYCCEACVDRSQQDFTEHLVGGDPKDLDALLAYCKEHNVKYPLMIAKFMGKMVADEKSRAGADPEEDEWTLWEHLDKLQYLELKPTPEDEEECALVVKLLGPSMPGFEDCKLSF